MCSLAPSLPPSASAQWVAVLAADWKARTRARTGRACARVVGRARGDSAYMSTSARQRLERRAPSTDAPLSSVSGRDESAERYEPASEAESPSPSDGEPGALRARRAHSRPSRSALSSAAQSPRPSDCSAPSCAPPPSTLANLGATALSSACGARRASPAAVGSASAGGASAAGLGSACLRSMRGGGGGKGVPARRT
jgi:hypothetical protein